VMLQGHALFQLPDQARTHAWKACQQRTLLCPV
jgi:hypothetical protein